MSGVESGDESVFADCVTPGSETPSISKRIRQLSMMEMGSVRHDTRQPKRPAKSPLQAVSRDRSGSPVLRLYLPGGYMNTVRRLSS